MGPDGMARDEGSGMVWSVAVAVMVCVSTGSGKRLLANLHGILRRTGRLGLWCRLRLLNRTGGGWVAG
jgi:hypothetical protein